MLLRYAPHTQSCEEDGVDDEATREVIEQLNE